MAPSAAKDIKMAPSAKDPTRLITSCIAVTYKFLETPGAPATKDAAKVAKQPAVKQ